MAVRGSLGRILIAGALSALAFPAAAAGEIELKRLDARAYPKVRAAVVTARPSAAAPVLWENGARVSGLRAENLGRAKSVVLAIDRSRSMTGPGLQDAISAARAFLAAKRQGDRVAVVSFGTEAVRLTAFSTARIDVDSALRTLAVDEREGTALYDAVSIASRALASEAAGARVIVLLTDGRDVSSEATLAQAVRAARAARATVYPIGIEGEQFSPNALHRVARETGGSYRGASSTEALEKNYAAIAGELRRTWRVEYVTAARPGEQLRLEARVAGLGRARSSLRIPSATGAPVGATEEPSRLLPGALYGSAWARWLFALSIGLIVLVAAGIGLAEPKGTWVRQRLAAHVRPARPQPERAPRRGPSTLLPALYGLTERTLGRQRTWGRIERLLEQADLPLRTAEFVYFAGACGFVLALVTVAAPLPALAVVLAFTGGALAPLAFAWFKARRRIRAFEAQLPDLLITLASSLRAGHSLRQGIQAVVEEGQEPAKKEFGRVVAEASLGRPMEEALADMAKRLGSAEFEYVVTAVTVQREVGGALATLFDVVADTVRSRQQFQRKVRSLTAMGRLSAFILIGLPFLVAAALTALNSEYMDPLYHTSTGHMLIAIGLVMMAVGSLILRKIVSFTG